MSSIGLGPTVVLWLSALTCCREIYWSLVIMTSDLCHINLNHLEARCLSFFQVTVHEISVLNYSQQRIFYRSIACDDELYLVKKMGSYSSAKISFRKRDISIKITGIWQYLYSIKNSWSICMYIFNLKIG